MEGQRSDEGQQHVGHHQADRQADDEHLEHGDTTTRERLVDKAIHQQ
jgi:hypothetical protein